VVDADGFEVVYFIHGPGMTFGEPGYFAVDHHRVVSVQALTASVVIRLGRANLTPFIEAHPVIKDRVMERLASNTRWQSTMIASMFRRPLADRVALRLLELADSSGEKVDGAPVTPKIAQSTLAAMVGVSREHVNRALAALAADGYIRAIGGRYVIV